MKYNIELFFIKSLPDDHLERCLQTLLQTAGDKLLASEYWVVAEKESREQTLNWIIEKRNSAQDTLIIADDIRFRPGWFQALENNYNQGDIIGFSMIDARTGKLQDFGYDFVDLDGKLTYRGLYKHEDPHSLCLPEYRCCDAVTGCAMLIKSHVFDFVHEFPIEGANRWGELIFSYIAAKQKMRTVVLGAHLEHYAISTKQKSFTSVSSISWLVERELWDKVVNFYLSDVVPVRSIYRSISKDLRRTLELSDKVLIYGCGTVADYILSNLKPIAYEVCTGLTEEIGKTFHGKIVLDVNAMHFDSFDTILITPIGYDDKIIGFFPEKTFNKLIGVHEVTNGTTFKYEKRQIQFQPRLIAHKTTTC